MKKITRMVLISAIFVTSGLTAKIANENYKAVVDNDERIHKAYELAKKPNKAAVLESIVDAAVAEPDERIRDAVVIDPAEPKVVRVKTKVTTSAGVSPITSVMDKKSVNKAEEFIEKVAHPAEVVMDGILEYSPDSIPVSDIPVQKLNYKIKDIFPTFEEVILTYKIILPEITSRGYAYDPAQNNDYMFDVKRPKNGSVFTFNGIFFYRNDWYGLESWRINDKQIDGDLGGCYWSISEVEPIIKFDPVSRTLDYSNLAPFKNSADPIPFEYSEDNMTCKEVYTFLAGVETGKYPLLTGLS